MNGARQSRLILRSLFTPGSRKFWDLPSHEARLLYLAMLLNAHDDGTVEADGRSLSAIVPRLGVSEKQSIRLLKSIISIGLVTDAPNAPDAQHRRYVKLLDFSSSQSNDSEKTCRPGTDGANGTGSDAQSFIHDREIERQKDGAVRGIGGSGEIGKSQDDPGAAMVEARRAYWRIAGRGFKSFGRGRPVWDRLVRAHGQDVVVAAVKLWATEMRETGKREFLRSISCPATMFLKNAEEYIEAVESPHIHDDAAQAPQEELIEWVGHGVKLTRKQIAQFEAREAEERRLREEAERNKPWEPPSAEEG